MKCEEVCLQFYVGAPKLDLSIACYDCSIDLGGMIFKIATYKHLINTGRACPKEVKNKTIQFLFDK